MRPAIGSWPRGWVVRRVVRDDVRALIGGGYMDPAYCAGDPAGYAAECSGDLVAVGLVTWDIRGRCWGWFNWRRQVPAMIVHRCALEMLAMLRTAGEPAIHMICDLSKPRAEKWARRLGFVRDVTLEHPWGPVLRCNLSA